jgi:hypothetical protein
LDETKIEKERQRSKGQKLKRIRNRKVEKERNDMRILEIKC